MNELINQDTRNRDAAARRPCLFPGRWHRSVRASALDDAHEDHDDGDDEQDVDEAAHGVGRDESKQPGDDEDEGEGV